MAVIRLLLTRPFAIVVRIAPYMCVRCYTSPNNPPQSYRWPEKDDLMQTAPGRLSFTFNSIAVVVFDPTYAYLALKHQSPGTINHNYCPNAWLEEPYYIRDCLFSHLRAADPVTGEKAETESNERILLPTDSPATISIFGNPPIDCWPPPNSSYRWPGLLARIIDRDHIEHCRHETLRQFTRRCFGKPRNIGQ